MTGSKSVRNLTQGKIFSQILFFAIPVIIGNLLQELYNVVDTWQIPPPTPVDNFPFK